MHFLAEKAVLPILLALISVDASAFAMVESFRKELNIEFENGDKATISCPKQDKCQLKLSVNGKQFTYGSADFNGRILVPDHLVLYSGPGNGRDEYFVFEVSVSCQEEFTTPGQSYCYASGAVRKGEPLLVTLDQRIFNDKAIDL